MEKKAAIYIRVSTSDQNTSVEAQREKCLAYCKYAGVEVVGIFEDVNVSGGIPIFRRPEGNKIYKLLESKEINYIVSLKLDRMFRDVEDCSGTLKRLDKKGTHLILVEFGDQPVDTSTASGRMFLNMASVFSEFEKNKIGERTKFALNHKKKNGLKYCGNPPFGLMHEDNKLVKHPEKFKILRKMFKLKEKGYSYQMIADELGFKQKSQVWKILNNNVYERFL